MRNLFKRVSVSGEWASLVNFLRTILFLFSIYLVAGDGLVALIRASSFKYGGGEAVMGPHQFVETSYVMIAMGCIGLVFFLLSFWKYKTSDNMFFWAFFALLFINVIERIMTGGYVVSALTFYSFVILFSLLLWEKQGVELRRALLIPFYVVFLMNLVSVTEVSIWGKVYNEANYINHYRLKGHHEFVTSVTEQCTTNNPSYRFKYGFFIIEEPCYFERYMKDDEKLTLPKLKFLQIYYGGMLELHNFYSMNEPRSSIKNYTPEIAIYVFQKGYESMKRRHEMEKSQKIQTSQTERKKALDKMTETRMEMLNGMKKTYKKSKQMPAKEFVRYLKKDNNKDDFYYGDIIVSSLENYEYNEDGDAIDFETIKALKDRVANSENSTLFNDAEISYSPEIVSFLPSDARKIQSGEDVKSISVLSSL